MTWYLSEIAAMADGVLIGEDRVINAISTDSRSVKSDELFIALVGERFDAHDFIDSIKQQAGAVFVHEKVDCDLPQVVVKDTLQALGQFAKQWRKQFTRPVIGLTGSNGKTTVKEMLAAILSCKGKVMATFGNLNNEIGVPLTLLRLRDDDYAVVEMGANHFGEIDYLTQITRPDVAILNNAGAAHLEGFGDVKGVSRAKAEIFRGLTLEGIAVINRDDDYADYWISCNSNRDVIRFGFSEQADVKASVSDAESDDRLLLTVGTESLSILLCLQGHHNKMNALAASAAALAIGIDLQTIKQGLENLRPVKGRLAPKKGIKGIEIIDDTYNANPDSARVAVDVLSRKKTAKRILVLGDMGELGDNTAQLHADIGVYAKQQGIDKLYCLGHYSQQAAEKFEEGAYSFNEIKPLLDCLKQELESSMTVLVKGSRAMKMERIVEALSNQNVIPQEVVKCS